MSRYIKTPSYIDSMPVDISFVFENEKPAGKHGFLTCAGEDFRFEDGTLAKFWGVCMNGGAAFPEHDYAEKVARRLAMAGVNCVRLHQLDGEYHTPNIFCYRKGKRVDNTRKLDPTSMDRLDYFVKCLKDEGIYCYLDMMVFRRFKLGDGVVDADKFTDVAGKPYSMFDPTMIELQKEYCTNVWTHYNPYTGLQYKDDPVFILSEVVNENDIWIKSHRASAGTKPTDHPPYYDNMLREMYGQWAKKQGIDVDIKTVDIWNMEGEDAELVNRFKLEKTYEFNKTMYEHMKSIGVRIPVTASNRLRNIGFNIYAQEHCCDYMDNHHYYYDWAWGEDDKFGTNAQINGYPHIMANLPTFRVSGRPFYVSEWDMPWPNSYRAEGPVYYAAICALQGWGGMGIHTYAYGTNLEHMDIIGKEASSSTLGGVPYREGIFSCWNDPAKFGLFYHSALIVRRGDVSPANKKVGVRVPFEIYSSKKAYETGLEVHRLATILDGMSEEGCDEVINNTDAIAWENPTRIVSDNGQVWRDLKGKFGGIDTDRTKIVYGKLGVVKHGVVPKAGTEVSGMKVESNVDFGVVALSSLTDDPIKTSNNMLLSTIGRARNTDVCFDGEKMIDYGKAPIVSEVIRAKITIETDRTDLKVWGVNAEGYYVGALPTKFEDGKMTFAVGDKFPCLYYLIVAE